MDTKIPLPRTVSEFVEIALDEFRGIEKVTVAEWHAALALLKNRHAPELRRVREANRPAYSISKCVDGDGSFRRRLMMIPQRVCHRVCHRMA